MRCDVTTCAGTEAAKSGPSNLQQSILTKLLDELMVASRPEVRCCTLQNLWKAHL